MAKEGLGAQHWRGLRIQCNNSAAVDCSSAPCNATSARCCSLPPVREGLCMVRMYEHGAVLMRFMSLYLQGTSNA